MVSGHDEDLITHAITDQEERLAKSTVKLLDDFTCVRHRLQRIEKRIMDDLQLLKYPH